MITLVSDDQRQISAHKLVLSSCSGYFKTILKQNKHENLLLCLEGISCTDLQQVLDYIYLGEVQIHKEQMDRFIYVAQRLQLDGLMLMNPEEYLTGKRDNAIVKNTKQEEQYKMAKTEHFLPQVPLIAVTEKSSMNSLKDNNEKKEEQGFQMTKRLPKPVLETEVEKQPSSSGRIFETNRGALKADKIEIIEEHYKDGKLISKEALRSILSEFYYKNDNRGYTCTVCQKVSDSQAHAREHCQIHLQGVNFPCPICKNNFRTTMARRRCLRKHNISEYQTVDMNLFTPVDKNESEQVTQVEIIDNETDSSNDDIETIEDLQMTVTTSENEANVPEPILFHGKQISNEEYETMNTAMYKQDGALFSCIICNKVYQQVSDVKEHVDVHIEGLSFKCGLCGKGHETQSARKLHNKDCLNYKFGI